MGFVKVVKNKAYFKRYQVKFKRRRECKTDYYARKRLLIQDKNKYKTPKYRFVVRFSNRDITCQIFSADLDHDVCLATAYSHELSRYGVKAGYTNFSAAYCTGLLLARRVNTKFGLDYAGLEDEEEIGADYSVEVNEEGAAPFKALLDVGLKRTTTGSKIFGALKGACDGGLDIPHNDRRFPGTVKEDGEYVPNPDTVRKYIYGGHVSEYMDSLSEKDEEAFNRQFSGFIKAGVTSDNMEDMYKSAHAAIRENPNIARAESELGNSKVRTGKRPATYEKKRYNKTKLSIQQRKGRIKSKLKARGIVSLAGK
jgi:large subunit ribosomal protein L5e